MVSHSIDGIEILLWPTSAGMSAFAAPWTFDLEYDAGVRATIDAHRWPLNAGDYPSKVDHYRVLDGPSRARILKAALARREEYLGARDFEQYLVRHHQPGIDEAAFLRIVAEFVQAWRRRTG